MHTDANKIMKQSYFINVQRMASYTLCTKRVIQLFIRMRSIGNHNHIEEVPCVPTFFTNCTAFQKTVSKKDLGLIPKFAGWALIMKEYRYTIEHQHARKGKHVNVLS